jgi:trimethylamine---corrinoid protein Co-methyltransferase
MADEMVAMAKFFAHGIPVNEQTLALDVIDRGCQGNGKCIFLSDPHTFTHFKTAHLMPDLMDRSRFETWEKQGKTDLFTRCNEKAKALLSSHKVKKTPRTQDAPAAFS